MWEVINHWFTARDNVTYSLSKVMGTGGAGSMIYNFIHTGSSDFVNFGAGLAAVMAALAAKYYVEGMEK